MINGSDVTKALEEQLKSRLSSTYRVERSTYLNADPDETPWVGVYKAKIAMEPRTLGGQGVERWKQTFTLKVLVQASSLDATECDELLEEAIKEVMDAITYDITLGGKLLMLNALDVTYSYNETESETLYFQNAEIEITAEARTT